MLIKKRQKLSKLFCLAHHLMEGSKRLRVWPQLVLLKWVNVVASSEDKAQRAFSEHFPIDSTTNRYQSGAFWVTGAALSALHVLVHVILLLYMY